MHTKREIILLVSIFLIFLIGVGYAYLSSNLNINGSTSIKVSTWDIHFENVQVKEGSVSADTPVIDTNKTTVTYDVSLKKPGDYFEFTVDAVNSGTVDAMIDTVLSTLNNSEITSLPNYLDYSVTYSDGLEILEKQKLDAGDTETYKVRVEYNKDIESSDLPGTNQSLSFAFNVNYVQADGSALDILRPVSFITDGWDTIIEAVQSGNIDAYSVGDTKEIDLGDLGVHIVRISNMSTPEECLTEGFSQTACGFVLEFADVITTHRINPYSDGSTNGDGNKGGWEYSEMRTFLNGEVYNSFPSVLRSAIINTSVVSGYGSMDSSNFTTTDKIYLLSTHEIWIDDDGSTRVGISRYDTAYSMTRQLDYYFGMGTNNTATTRGVKMYNGTNYDWWLRTASGSNNRTIYNVQSTGAWYASYVSSNDKGVSPAFRIG